MVNEVDKIVVLTTKIRIPPIIKETFIDWQGKFNSTIAAFPGFVSLEILSPRESSQRAWVIVQRFANPTWLNHWQKSENRLTLIEELKTMEEEGNLSIHEETSGASLLQGGVTEVFVTQVSPGKEELYREWVSKIHKLEARFPGFKGFYLQAPTPGQKQNWISLLQFDTQENLDNWLFSHERETALRDCQDFVASLDSHRVVTPYAGWFNTMGKEEGGIPPVWKQTMLVLLVLFPIVMFELKYLPFFTSELNPSLANFIGNAISVTLIAWPFMPLAILCLGWWLAPKSSARVPATIFGTGFIFFLYLIEVIIFWNFL